ncbi:GGDEF domain-containing protein [Fusibacter ferrireducens]|uniref:GGDEF domain-containing protein n=1 Tax=Fusibacter ferrireducens TaxID=2785058 RepID=A0ABR9ZR70_9FIRM|nr:GGDEF domain-containing protein [Fusibacter ferrireducens]MBF4692947.1 GGDEF domain-containing protein [Fusibacter ferrireducens]
MTDFNRYLLQEGKHDSKKKLALIFILVSMFFCFAYTIVFMLLGAIVPAVIQLVTGGLFVLAYFLLKSEWEVSAKVLAIVSSFLVTSIQSILFFGNAYGFQFMIIGHIVVVVMIFNYNRKYANSLLIAYLLLSMSTFIYIENLEFGIYENLVSTNLEKWFYNTAAGGTIIALIIIMYFFSKEIDQAKEDLFVMTLTDELTNLYNRRIFMEYGNKLFESNLEAQFTLLLIDIDHFKVINDTYGHKSGDEALKQLSSIFKEQMRMYDLVARYGGEEFAIILPRTDRKSGEQIANRILRAVANKPIRIGVDQEIHITVSIGMSDRSIPHKDFSSMISKADEALYHAKNQGRNQVVLHPKTEFA